MAQHNLDTLATQAEEEVLRQTGEAEREDVTEHVKRYSKASQRLHDRTKQIRQRLARKTPHSLVQPLFLSLSVSSHGIYKLEASEEFKQNPVLDQVLQCLVKVSVSHIKAAQHVRSTIASASRPSPAPERPESPVVPRRTGPRAQSTTHSKQQKILNAYWKSELKPVLEDKLAGLATARIAETGQNFSDALLHVQRGGYTLHAQDQKGCLQGCPACFKARQLLLWPDNTPLLSSSAFLSKDAVQRCWQNYKLQLPEAEVQPALKGPQDAAAVAPAGEHSEGPAAATEPASASIASASASEQQDQAEVAPVFGQHDLTIPTLSAVQIATADPRSMSSHPQQAEAAPSAQQQEQTIPAPIVDQLVHTSVPPVAKPPAHPRVVLAAARPARPAAFVPAATPGYEQLVQLLQASMQASRHRSEPSTSLSAEGLDQMAQSPGLGKRKARE